MLKNKKDIPLYSRTYMPETYLINYKDGELSK